jgi:hypothetical protein
MTRALRKLKVQPLETRVRNYPKMMSLKDREGLAAEATLIAEAKLRNAKLKNKKKPLKRLAN